jgi:hypothetical protein
MAEILEDREVRAFPEIGAVSFTAVGERSTGFDHVQSFLQRFGYLPSGSYAPGTLDAATSEALAKYQEFGGLEATGRFDGATRQRMTRPRCGLPDLAHGVRFTTTCPWGQTDLTYAFDRDTADVPGQTERDGVRAAFRTWQRLGALTFREVGMGDNPHIRVGWRAANDADFNMTGGIIAHADFPPACSVVTQTLPKPVHFDDSEHAWAIGAVPGAFDIETVALHEIGHIVGLGHSVVAGAVMLSGIAPNSTKRRLTRDDVDGFNRIYPTRTVPHVREMLRDPATLAIRAVGLEVRWTGATSAPGAWVYQQSPRGGRVVNVGSIVTLQLRTGPIP